MHPFHSLCLRIVTAATERLVRRLAATAKSNAVANFEGLAVRRFNWDTATHPNWTAHAYRGVFNQSDGLLKIWLNYLLGVFVTNQQTPRGAVTSLFNGYSFCFWFA